MTIQAPSGWNTFAGGAITPDLCGEVPPPTGDIPAIVLTPSELDLRCALGQHEITVAISGGVPPFVWVATAGVLTVTDIRQATISIHPTAPTISFWQPVLDYFAQDCPGQSNCPDTPNIMRTEATAQMLLFGYDCLGVQVPLLGSLTTPIVTSYSVAPYADPIGSNTADRTINMSTNWVGTLLSDTGACLPSDPDTMIAAQCYCTTDADKAQSVRSTVVTAGKTAVNGLVHAAAVALDETINFPVARGACTVNTVPGNEGRISFLQRIDVRTQAMVEAECCIAPVGTNIVVTVTDAAGIVAFLTIPVVA